MHLALRGRRSGIAPRQCVNRHWPDSAGIVGAQLKNVAARWVTVNREFSLYLHALWYIKTTQLAGTSHYAGAAVEAKRPISWPARLPGG